MADFERDPLTGRAVRIVDSAGPPLPEGRSEFLELSTGTARAAVDLWAQRTIALGGRDDVAYVMPSENRAVEAARDGRRGEIHAFDFVPPAARRELEADACTLCDAVPDGLLVDGANGWTTSVPAVAAWPYELVIAPRDHIADMPSLDDANRNALAVLLPRAVAALDAHFGAPTPLMTWIHQRPYDGGDWPRAHVHIHITPLWRETGVPRVVTAAELGTEVFFNAVPPFEAAANLRFAIEA